MQMPEIPHSGLRKMGETKMADLCGHTYYVGRETRGRDPQRERERGREREGERDQGT